MNQAELDAQLEADIAALMGENNQSETMGFIHKKKDRKRFVDSIKNVVKNPVASVTRNVKRWAPAAIGAAALWYGAPYAMSAIKAGGSYISGAVKGLMPGAKAIGGAPQAMTQAGSIISPEVLSMAKQLTMQQLRKRGVNMQSPAANMAVDRYVAGTANNMQRYAAPPTDYKKFILPAIAAGGAFLALKG